MEESLRRLKLTQQYKEKKINGNRRRIVVEGNVRSLKRRFEAPKKQSETLRARKLKV